MRHTKLLTLLPALLLAGEASLLAQQAHRPATSVTGARPPRLSVDFHKGRRQELMKRVGGGVILFRGDVDTRRNTPFVQEHHFWYLTGVRDPHCELMLLPESGESVLFVPPFSRMKARWDGDKLRPGEKTAKRFGVSRVVAARTRNPASSWFAEVDAALEAAEKKVLWICARPEEPSSGSPDYIGRFIANQKKDLLDGRGDRTDAFKAALQKRYGDRAKVQDLTRELYAMRAVKTAEEVRLMRYTSRVASIGIAEAMKAAAPGQKEYELGAIADYTFRRHGAQAIGYTPIVGSGPNGCILHHWRNDRTMNKGDLVVMDFAPEIEGYTSDVTRTFPVGGTFTKEGRKLVQDVWDSQKAILEAIKPGVTFSQLSRIGNGLLLERGYKPGVHILHGPCHSVGMAVHDPGLRGRLEVGMIFTVEPGAYLVEEGMGCRIEDVVLVTEDGYEILSDGCPSHPDEIEKLAREKGLVAPPMGNGKSGLEKKAGGKSRL